MTGSRQKRRRVFILLLSMIVLMGACVALLPHLFQLSLVQKKTTAFLARQISGSITCRKETLSLFPRPCIRFHDVRLADEEGFSGTLDLVTAYPHLVSLLRGRFNLAKVTARGIDCTVTIPEQDQPPTPALILGALRQRLGAWMDLLGPVSQSRFGLDIQEGRITLVQGEQTVLSFRDFNSRLRWRLPVMSLDISTRADLWDQGNLVLHMDASTRNISGRFTAKHITPKGLAELMFPTATLGMEAAALDAGVSWETDNFETWRISFDASNPDITFRKGKTLLTVRGEKAAGEINRDAAGLHVSISDLDLAAPELRLAGGFDLDTEAPSAGWQVTAEKIDIASLKEAAQFFASRFNITQKISGILQEGVISRVTMGQEAGEPKNFRDISNFSLQGHLDRGTIYVPKPDLLLTESSGNISLSNGILDVSDIQTRLGNSTGSRGTYTMALTGAIPRPFHVAGNVRADVAQLPPLLARLTKGTLLSDEMARITSADGSASGILMLDQASDSLQVAVDISEFALSAAYDRIPFPVALSGGGFSYQSGGVQAQGLDGNIGDSSFAGLSAAMSWVETPHLSITSARGQINTGELVSWIGNALPACGESGGMPASTGRIVLDHLQFEGPVNSPADWRFQSDGQVKESLTICIPLFPEAITMYQGNFTATHEKIDILDADLSVLDTRLCVTGSLEGYSAQKPRAIDVLIEGDLGQDFSNWLFGYLDIPDMFRWRAPIEVTPLILHWHEKEGWNISGAAVTATGPRASFDMGKKSGVFTIADLDIRDKDTRARATFTRDTAGLALSFSGTLGHATVSAFLAENQVLSGSVQGNFSARYDFKTPFTSGMTGWLMADGIDMAPVKQPLEISQVSVTGDGGAADIAAARFTWKGNEFSSSGRIARAENGILMDLALATEQVNWPGVKTLLDSAAKSKTPTPDFLFGNVRLTCGSLYITPALTFEPLKAELIFDGSRIDIVFQQADACGVSFPGSITLLPDHVLFSFQPSAMQKPLETTVACLWKGKVLMDGVFDLTGDLTFQWNRLVPFMESVEGTTALTAKDGRIYRAVLLGKLFSLLNIGEILSGQFPDFEKEGFPYKTSVFSGRFEKGRLKLESGVIDGPAMKIFFEGSEDLAGRKHDLTIVVAPLKTVDAVIGRIPGLNNILEKGVVIYPVKVNGAWDKPELTLLSPTAVGGEVLGIMLRTLRLPVTIFEKIFPRSKPE